MIGHGLFGTPQAEARFEVSASAAIKLVRWARETGSTAPAKIGGYRKPVLAGYEELLRELAQGKSAITLAELQTALVERGAPKASLTGRSGPCCASSACHTKNPEGR